MHNLAASTPTHRALKKKRQVPKVVTGCPHIYIYTYMPYSSSTKPPPRLWFQDFPIMYCCG